MCRVLFGAVVAVNPFAMEHIFPAECLLHCASKALYLSVDQKKAGRECTLPPTAWAKRLSLAGVPPGRAQGQLLRFSPGNASLVWHCTCTVLIDGPSGTPRESFPRFPLRPRKPDSARSHTSCDSDTSSRRQVGNMPDLGIGSISGIIHMIARFPHAARAVVVVAVLIAIWR